VIEQTDAVDERLVEEFRRGRRAAFDELVARHESRVYAVALRMTGHREDALDVTQDVFISMLRALPRFRAEARVSTWIHRVTVNAALDHLRRRARRPVEELRDIHDRPIDDRGPDDAAIAGDRAHEVRAAIMALAPEQRAVIVLHDLEDLDYREVAAALEIPLGTVKSRIHRARLELARHLGHLREHSGAGGPLKEES
jgi:RNA polymerase sigma-70 factor, ECF subfamily